MKTWLSHGSFLFIALLNLTSCESGTDSAKTSISQMIGPEGGTITLNRISLIFPPGALTSPLEITISETDLIAPDRYVMQSPIYRLEPHGTMFEIPVRISIAPAVDTLSDGVFIAENDALDFQWLPGEVFDEAVTGYTSHFSFAGLVNDTFCKDKVNGHWCAKNNTVLVQCKNKKVIDEGTCKCLDMGANKDDACESINWDKAPWPAGTCLKVTQGYYGDRGNPYDHVDLYSKYGYVALDLVETMCAKPPSTTLVCPFVKCRVKTDCRGPASGLWGNNVCIEELSTNGVATGTWQFIAHLDKVDVAANAIMNRGAPIGAMGDTGNTDGCNPNGKGTHFHLEQGNTTPIGGKTKPLPIPMPTVPPTTLSICATGSNSGCANETFYVYNDIGDAELGNGPCPSPIVRHATMKACDNNVCDWYATGKGPYIDVPIGQSKSVTIECYTYDGMQCNIDANPHQCLVNGVSTPCHQYFNDILTLQATTCGTLAVPACPPP